MAATKNGYVYTQFTNPYSSTQQSFATILQNLARSGNVPPIKTIQSLQTRLDSSSSSSLSSSPTEKIEWTLDLASTLTSYTVHLVKQIQQVASMHSTESTGPVLATLHLLISALNKWEDSLLYAIVVEHHLSNRDNLLVVFQSLASEEGHPLRDPSLVGLACIWRALDRLQQHTSLDPNRPDTPWWNTLDNNEIAKVTLILVTHLCQPVESQTNDLGAAPDGSRYPLPHTEQVNTACASLLCSLLKYDMNEWLYTLSKERLSLLCQRLMGEIHRLNNPDLCSQSPSQTLPFSLLATCLLSLMQWRHSIEMKDFANAMHSTSLVENVLQFTFPCGNNPVQERGVPRWVHDTEFCQSRFYGQELVYCWSLCGGGAWSVICSSERRWRPYVEEFWKDMMQPMPQSIERLNGVLLWHTIARLTTRSTLFSVLQKHDSSEASNEFMVEPCRRLLASLFHLCRDSSYDIQVSASALLFRMLSDRSSESTHDDVSRAIWMGLDERLLQDFVNTVVESAITEEIRQPVLLSLLNGLDCQLHSNEFRKTIMRVLDVQSVEKLIHLVTPKQIRIDFMDALESQLDDSLDTETPPANNLSRLDEKSICIEQEDEKEPRGLDNHVRLSAATALAHMGYCTLDTSEESICLLQSRICSAVNDFLASFIRAGSEKDGHGQKVSLDLVKRLFRLETAVATPENEDFVVTMRYNRELMAKNEFIRQVEEKTVYQQRLEDSVRREKVLQSEKDSLQQQQKSQSLVFQRETNRVKKNATQDSRQLVAIHAAERSKAENRANEFSRQAVEAARRLAEAESRAQSCQAAEASATEELRKAQSRVIELDQQTETLRRELAEQEAKTIEIEDELKSRNAELENMDQQQRELEEEVHGRDEQISDIQVENEKLHDNLEDLFADMVSLAQIYQEKENNEATAKEKSEKEIQQIATELSVERGRTQEMQEKEKRLRLENEKLFNKVAKYKKALQAELDTKKKTERRKQNDPISYINQLHQSGISDKSTRTSKSSSRSTSRYGKENDVSTSSSQLRKYR